MSKEDAQLDRLLDGTVAQLRKARSSEAEQRQAIRDYLAKGDELDLSPTELWDYFDISSPSLPEQADYSDQECERAHVLFEQEAESKFG